MHMYTVCARRHFGSSHFGPRATLDIKSCQAALRCPRCARRCKRHRERWPSCCRCCGELSPSSSGSRPNGPRCRQQAQRALTLRLCKSVGATVTRAYRQCGLRLSYVDSADRVGPSSTTAASTGIMETMSGLTRSVDHMASTMSQLAKAITASPNPSSTAAANTRIMETMSGLTQSVDQVASSMSQLADVITASANPSSTAASSTRRRSFKG